MSISEIVKSKFKREEFTLFSDNTFCMDAVVTDDVFEDAVLKPSGITMEQYQLMQKHTNELQDEIAVQMFPRVKKHFENNPTLKSVQVHYPILRTEGHELINSIVVHKADDDKIEINSRVERDESYVSLSAEVIKLYEEINN